MAAHDSQFVWYELATTDMDGAIAFYTDVIGWQSQPWEHASHPYAMWVTDGGPMGAVMPMPPAAEANGAPPHWGAYVGLPDVDAATEKAVSLGATVVLPPTDIPENVGRFSVIFDPQGAPICLFTPSQGEQPMVGGNGRVAWHELYTTDPDAAWAFYNTMFGWTLTGEMDMGPMGTYRMFSTGGEPTGAAIGPGAKGTNAIGGIMKQPPGLEGRARWSFYITVPDLDAAVDRVKKNGGQVMMGPMDSPGGDRIAGCMDGQGAVFWLHGKG